MLLHHLVVSIHTSLAHNVIEWIIEAGKNLQSPEIQPWKEYLQEKQRWFNSSSDNAFPFPLLLLDSGGLLHMFICTFFFCSVIWKIIVSSMSHRSHNSMVSSCYRTWEKLAARWDAVFIHKAWVISPVLPVLGWFLMFTCPRTNLQTWERAIASSRKLKI